MEAGIQGNTPGPLAGLVRFVVSSRRGIADTAAAFAPQVVTFLSGFAVSVMLARGLGPEVMGQYALILSFSGLAGGLTDLSIQQTAIRFASRAAAQGDTESQHAVLRWAFRLRMLLVLVVAGTSFLLAPTVAGQMWHSPDLSLLARVGLLACVIGTFSSLSAAYLQSLKRFRFNGTIAAAQAVLAVLCVVAVTKFAHWTLWLAVAINVGAQLAGALLYVAAVPRTIFVRRRGLASLGGRSLADAWRFRDIGAVESEALDGGSVNAYAAFSMLSAGIVSLSLRTDIWLQGAYLDKGQIGHYSVANYLTMPMTMLLAAINMALWPRVSALADRGRAGEFLRTLLLPFVLLALAGVAYAMLA